MEQETMKVKVALLTPYLFQTVQDLESRYDLGEVFNQIVHFGYQPDKIIRDKEITDGKRIVMIDRPKDLTTLALLDCCAGADLVISGSADDAEDFVLRFLKDTGLIVARFSIFYRGPSRYTGMAPEDTGYALDIPKDPDAVKALLTHGMFLDGLVKREEAQMRVALECLSTRLPKPILATPYLTKCLDGGR
ncbi:hypothetical protein KY317_02935 [Candidatus Woesearchaeota archaeon]|nr:hypothetical protein [Candidatus Woesearchaeota archaeon]